jgi:hypothetical protein
MHVYGKDVCILKKEESGRVKEGYWRVTDDDRCVIGTLKTTYVYTVYKGITYRLMYKKGN